MGGSRFSNEPNEEPDPETEESTMFVGRTRITGLWRMHRRAAAQLYRSAVVLSFGILGTSQIAPNCSAQILTGDSTGDIGRTQSETISHRSLDPSRFRVLLQPIGEWSGDYSGEDLGYDGNTVQIFLQDCGRFNERGPEFTDINLHLASVSQEINRRIPTDFNGLIILDARFYPISLCAPGAEKWANPRIAEVRRRRSELNESDALIEADRRWQIALDRILGATIKRIRDLRPNAQIAIRDTVTIRSNANASASGEPAVDLNDKAMWLWKRVDAICPDIAFDANSTLPDHTTNAELTIQQKIAAAARIAGQVEMETGRRPQVLPMLNSTIVPPKRSVPWDTDSSGVSVGEWISAKQTIAAFNAAVSQRADGIVLSQFVADHHPRLHSEYEFINEVLEGRVRLAMNQLRLGVFADADTGSDSPIAPGRSSTSHVHPAAWKPKVASSRRNRDPDCPPLTEDQLRRVRVRVVKLADFAGDSKTTLRSASSSAAEPRRIILNGGNTKPVRRTSRPTTRSRRTKPKGITIKRSEKSASQNGVTVEKETTSKKSEGDDGSDK